MTSSVSSPRHLEDDVLLRTGAIAKIRDVSPMDREALLTMHRELTPRSQYFRFFSIGPQVADTYIDRLIAQVQDGTATAFVVTVGDRIVGIGSCIPLSDTVAEVAFAVADDMHGQGVGTLLLERLADRADRMGITTFVASVLATNGPMLDVIQRSGFGGSVSRNRETIELRFSVALTEHLMDAMADRERHSDAASISGVLRPTSVAVVGASRRQGSPGHAILAGLLEAGFTGPIYPVNQAADQVLGQTAYPTVAAIPGAVDLAVVAVPAPAVPQVVRQCADKGVPGIVICSSGFAEAGAAGSTLQNEVVRTARDGGMRVVGPNCLGVANTDPGVRLDATFAGTTILPGEVGLMTQSGAVGIAALRRASELGIGLSSFVSAGNKADVSGNDMLMYYADDDRTQVIAMYLESFGNPRKFSRIARQVSEIKPIVALIGGASNAGRRAASGHTSAAVTSSAAVDALFGQCGVIRAHSLEQFLHVTGLLSHQALPKGRRVAIVSNGGGPGVLTADACAEAGVELAELDAATVARVQSAVPGIASAENPIDLGAGTRPEEFAQALQAVDASPAVDAVIAVHTPVPGLDNEEFATAVAEVAGRLSTTTIAVMLGQRADQRPIAGSDTKIPVVAFPEDAARTLAPVMGYVAWRNANRGEAAVPAGVNKQAARQLVTDCLQQNPAGCRLDADDTRSLLGFYGIQVVPAIHATGAQSAIDAANWVGYPVALKVADPEVVHKADIGGIRLNLTDPDSVHAAYQELTKLDSVGCGGVVVQRQVGGGLELISGVTHDEVFGPLVMFGLGGTATELLADRVFRLSPLTKADATSAVRSLQASPLLFGYRGAPGVDVGAVEDLLVRVGQLAADLPQVAEIDLNPVIAYEHGIALVDAKVRLEPTPDHPSPYLPRLRPSVTSQPARGRTDASST